MISGNGFNGKLKPGIMKMVSDLDKSQAQRKCAPRNSMALRIIV